VSMAGRSGCGPEGLWRAADGALTPASAVVVGILRHPRMAVPARGSGALAATRTAVPVHDSVGTRLPVRIHLVVQVTSRAGRDGPLPPPRVYAVRHCLEVGKVHAQPVAAKVVKLHPIGNRPDFDLVHCAVREFLAVPGDGNSPVAVAIRPQVPDPARAEVGAVLRNRSVFICEVMKTLPERARRTSACHEEMLSPDKRDGRHVR
jgi:hypothetical protein